MSNITWRANLLLTTSQKGRLIPCKVQQKEHWHHQSYASPYTKESTFLFIRLWWVNPNWVLCLWIQIVSVGFFFSLQVAKLELDKNCDSWNRLYLRDLGSWFQVYAYGYGNTVRKKKVQSWVNIQIRNPECIPAVGFLLLLAGFVLRAGEAGQSIQTSPT